MQNYISINNRKIELTDSQVKDIQKSFGLVQIKLKDIKVGDTFTIGNFEFIVLEQSGDTTAVILKDLLYTNEKFGINNNYNGSYVDDTCYDFAKEIAWKIGIENIIEHTVDLTADDGIKDYGKIKRRVSLLTTELYRRYVDILDKHKINNSWWLATAWSTPTHTNDTWVKRVCPSGTVNDTCSVNLVGVRPFCILNSDIFVSCEN